MMSELVESTVYEFEEFRFDARTGRLFKNETDEPVALQPKAAALLRVLLESGGRVLTKNEILDAVWTGSFVEEANLSQTIFVLRKALGDDKKAPRFIVTVPHHGYRFIATVAEKSAAQNVPPLETENRKSKIENRKPNNILLFAALFVVFALAFGFYYSRRRHEPETAREVRSIAVLPFQNTGGNEEEEYLGHGIAEVLLAKLGGIKTVVVRPAASVLKLTDAAPDARRIGGDLNVEAVVTGRVQRHGENIRVTVQLIRVSDGATLWAETFDDRYTNLFAVQDSIAQKVTASLALELTSDERELIARRYTADNAAYHAYLQGLFLWNKRTPENLQKAIIEFEKAKTLDPDFALAYAGLANCYVLLGENRVTVPHESVPKAREAALKALELDGRLAEARAAMGYILSFYDWNFPDAEREFRLAIEQNPSYATAYQWYAELLADLGRFDEAHRQIAIARRIDPTSAIILADQSHIFFNQRDYDKAVEVARECTARDVNFAFCHVNLGFALEAKGLEREAAEALAKAIFLLDEPLDAVEEVRRAAEKKRSRRFLGKTARTGAHASAPEKLSGSERSCRLPQKRRAGKGARLARNVVRPARALFDERQNQPVL